MLLPRLGPTALFPTIDQAHRGADLPTCLSSWSQRAWQAPEDSTGNITTGNPLTSSITRTVSTGKKQQDCTCQMPCYQNKARRGEILFLPFSEPCKRPRMGPWHLPSRHWVSTPISQKPSLATPASQELSFPFLNFHHTSSPLHNPLIHVSLHCVTFLASS